MPKATCSLDLCARPVRSRGLCDSHYARSRKGIPLDAPVRLRAKGTPEERWWQRVPVAPGCWEWQGSRLPTGYGQFSVDGKKVSAHRFSWEMHNGPIPAGMFVCHTCDNPPCVNPAHLFLGTIQDNNRDAWRKGRTTVPETRSGSEHPRATITEDTVRAIRADRIAGLEHRQIAELRGCTVHVVADVLRGRNWGHVV